MKRYRLFLIVLILPFATSIGRNARLAISAADGVWSDLKISSADQQFREDTTVLEPLHQPAKSPQPGEWRYDHLEPGQTFSQFALSEPTRMTPERNHSGRMTDSSGMLPSAFGSSSLFVRCSSRVPCEK